MKEIENEIIKTFIYSKNTAYIIYIKDYNNCYECYLQNKNYGIISLMFGVNKKETTMQEFIEVILANIDSHVKDYKETYEDDLLF